MGASEDRATLAEHERQRRAFEIREIMVPGHGTWTAEGILKLKLERDAFWALLVAKSKPKEWREMGML